MSDDFTLGEAKRRLDAQAELMGSFITDKLHKVQFDGVNTRLDGVERKQERHGRILVGILIAVCGQLAGWIWFLIFRVTP